ncbi:MAG: hypothetical protein AAF570_02290 [Bacteroidota bacterium]
MPRIQTPQAEMLAHLSQADPVLNGMLVEEGPPPIASTGSVFHDLVGCVIEQQIHYRSTKRIFLRRVERAGLEVLTPENFEVFERDGLKDLKISARKFETLNRVVAFFQANEVDWAALSDAEVRKVFGEMKGIGPWTVDMLLLYTLGRADIFPADDFRLKQGMKHFYELEEKGLKREMKRIAEGWAPYRSWGTLAILKGWAERKGIGS